jgi:hypothetical protein
MKCERKAGGDFMGVPSVEGVVQSGLQWASHLRRRGSRAHEQGPACNAG